MVIFNRLLASDTYGVISVWDRRMGALPCLELTTNSHSALNSIELSVENQVGDHYALCCSLLSYYEEDIIVSLTYSIKNVTALFIFLNYFLSA